MGTSHRMVRCEPWTSVLPFCCVLGACAPAPASPTADASSADAPPPTVDVPVTPSEPTATVTAGPPPPADTARWVGQWGSAACGARTYARWLDLGADGTATGSDRISPCPPGRACVWSGIVRWAGTWQAAGGTVTLSVSFTDNPAAAARLTLPTQLTWDQATPGPTEVSGDSTCAYRPRTAPKHLPKL